VESSGNGVGEEWHGIKGMVRGESVDAQPGAKRVRDGSLNRPSSNLTRSKLGRPGGASLPRNRKGSCDIS